MRLLPTLLCLAKLLLLAIPSTSFALKCLEDGTNSEKITGVLGTSLAIPADMPDGTIIWESEDRKIDIRCADDYARGSETVYFHLNPANANVGQGIRVGIRFNDQTITQSTGKVSTGQNSWLGCNWGKCYGWDKAKFTLTFKVFIQKYGKVPSSGYVGISEYRVFQLDGEGGLNPTPNSNINYVVTGMNNIRFVSCTPNLTVTPDMVDFGRVPITAGKVASSKNFTLDLNRSCETRYTVNARFTALKGNLINGLLVPIDNPSVGIALRNLSTNANVPFNQWFKLTELTGKVARNNFQADLLWLNDKATAGKFNAGARVDMYYE